MGKLGCAHLNVIEEWTPVDPSDPQALTKEAKKLKLVISLLLKARDRELLEEERRREHSHASIRRKAGLAA